VTIRDVIAWVDEIKPNAFSEDVKTEWVSNLEGRIAADVFLLGDAAVLAPRYVFPQDQDAVLLVKFPHDDIYKYWVQAKVDEANGEYNKYHNTLAIFNNHYSNFLVWFKTTYDPEHGYDGRLTRPIFDF